MKENLALKKKFWINLSIKSNNIPKLALKFINHN